MRGHGVVRHLAHSGDFAGVESRLDNFQQVAENGEPGGLPKGAKPPDTASISVCISLDIWRY